MRNDDLKKITEIKQYLLDPPASFKLYDYAVGYMEEAIAVLNNYPETAGSVQRFQQLLSQLRDRSIPPEGLRAELKQAGATISRLTSQ